MSNKNTGLSQEALETRLKEQLRKHRKQMGLGQTRAADLLSRSCSTYQRWESTGKGLTDIFNLLDVFQKFRFSTTEIIDVLGLPPLTLSEIKELYQDEETLKSIRENSIYSSIRQTRGEMDDYTLLRLIFIMIVEYSKRKGIQV